jgi:hypothetical protein
MLQAESSRVRFPIRTLDFSIELILPALWSTQPLTEISTRNLPGGVGRRVRLTTLPPSVSRLTRNVEASTSHNPMGLYVCYMDSFTSFVFTGNAVEESGHSVI